MQTVNGTLTLLNSHTPNPQVFWNGKAVPNLGVQVSFDGKVTIKVAEDPLLAEMTAAGIIIKRAAP